MADIFLSYAREDIERAQQLATALEANGWKVWWDRTIRPGRNFDEVIEAELAGAKCVVVLWSEASVGKHWVKTEAAEALNRGVLVPVAIADIKIPLQFRRIQTASLAHWDGAVEDGQFQLLLRAIEDHVRGRRTSQPQAAQAAPMAEPAAPKRAPSDAARRRVVIGARLIGAVLVVGAGWAIAKNFDLPLSRAKNSDSSATVAAPTPAWQTRADNVTYTIVSGHKERVTSTEFLLVLDIRVTVHDEPGINFWQDRFRLDIDGTKHAPQTRGSNQYVPGGAEHLESVQFRVFTKARAVTLYVGDSRTTKVSSIPLSRAVLTGTLTGPLLRQ